MRVNLSRSCQSGRFVCANETLKLNVQTRNAGLEHVNMEWKKPHAAHLYDRLFLNSKHSYTTTIYSTILDEDDLKDAREIHYLANIHMKK